MPQVVTHESRWTQIYWSAHDGVLKPYVRFVPVFMNTEAAGFSHGLTLGGGDGVFFDSEDAAVAAAKQYDGFFEQMERELVNDLSEKVALLERSLTNCQEELSAERAFDIF